MQTISSNIALSEKGKKFIEKFIAPDKILKLENTLHCNILKKEIDNCSIQMCSMCFGIGWCVGLNRFTLLF